MASATLKPHISRTLEAREFILVALLEVGVVYHQTGNESLPVSGHGGTYDRTLAGEIRPNFEMLLLTNASSGKLYYWFAYRSTLPQSLF